MCGLAGSGLFTKLQQYGIGTKSTAAASGYGAVLNLNLVLQCVHTNVYAHACTIPFSRFRRFRTILLLAQQKNYSGVAHEEKSS